MLKNKVLIGVFVMALALVGFSAEKAYAESCTAATTGVWTAITWTGCTGQPDATDDLIIPTAVVVTVDAAGALANTIVIEDAEAGANGITLSGAGTLTVTGAVSFEGGTGAAHSTLAVADGDLTAANIAIVDGSGAGDSVVSVATGGTITTTGTGIAFTVTHIDDTQLTATGTGSISLGGTGSLGAGGTVALAAGSTVAFTGAAQTVGPAYIYGHLSLSGSGAKTMTGVTNVAGNFSMAGSATATPVITTVGGNVSVAGTAVMTTGAANVVTGTLTVGTGATLNAAAFALTITSTTSVTGTLNITSATGTKTFTGAVTVNNGGVISESAAATLSFGDDVTIATGGTLTENGAAVVGIAGDLTNNGTYTASTGVHTFGTSAIAGTVSIPSLTGTAVTNNGTLTVSTLLAGTALTNSATGVLNIGDAITVTTLTATATGNTVNYTGAGAQTVKVTPYYNLGLSGAGLKAMNAVTVANDMEIATGSTANLTGSSTTNALSLSGVASNAGTYGFTGSGANNIDPLHFPGPGTGTLTVAVDSSEPAPESSGSGGGGGRRSSNNDREEVNDNDEVAVEGCAAGNLFSTTSGKACEEVVVGCGSGNAFSPITGQSCGSSTNNTVVINSPAGASGYDFGTATVKQGSMGAYCRAWQNFFNNRMNAGLVIDGNCGPKTMAAARTWQASAGLVADGLLGPASRAKALAQAAAEVR